VDGGEAVGEERGIGRLDEGVEFGGRLLEDEWPEVRDLGDEGGAFAVKGFGEAGLLADCVVRG